MVKPDKMFLFLVGIKSIQKVNQRRNIYYIGKKKKNFKFEKIKIVIKIPLKEDIIVSTFTDNFGFFVYSKWLESIRQ